MKIKIKIPMTFADYCNKYKPADAVMRYMDSLMGMPTKDNPEVHTWTFYYLND